MTIQHLPAGASAEAVAAVIAADGCAVIDRLASPDLLDQLDAEMADFVERTPYGTDDFAGPHTRRTGGLIARSPASQALVLDPLVLGTVDQVLAHVNNYQLHLTQLIRIEPGGAAQVVHRDQWAFDFFTFPSGYQVQCNTMWAATDFTEANGATRVVPGSHLAEDKLRYELADTEPAEMERGSALLYVGSLYHGGGPNTSDTDRVGVNITYSVGWLRQEENQFLTVPPETARELPQRLQRLLGYSLGAYALGYVDDLRDPLDVLMGRDNSTGSFAATSVLADNAGVATNG
jgi:ectoine hydroxylase-related dioxygenase (phytanoyl-CoA dioxygenase family)